MNVILGLCHSYSGKVVTFQESLLLVNASFRKCHVSFVWLLLATAPIVRRAVTQPIGAVASSSQMKETWRLRKLAFTSNKDSWKVTTFPVCVPVYAYETRQCVMYFCLQTCVTFTKYITLVSSQEWLSPKHTFRVTQQNISQNWTIRTQTLLCTNSQGGTTNTLGLS